MLVSLSVCALVDQKNGLQIELLKRLVILIIKMNFLDIKSGFGPKIKLKIRL